MKNSLKQKLKGAVVAFTMATAGPPASAQVSTITGDQDIKAAYSFAVIIAKNDELLRIAGFWAQYERNPNQDPFVRALIDIRRGKEPSSIAGKGVVAYCIHSNLSNRIAAMGLPIRNTVIARALNNKPLTVNDFGAISNDAAIALSNKLYGGNANPNNCPQAYKVYLR